MRGEIVGENTELAFDLKGEYIKSIKNKALSVRHCAYGEKGGEGSR